MADVDLNLFTYTTWSYTVTWTDPNGSAIDLTGYTASLKLRTTPTATPSLSLSIGSGITVATPSSGVIAITATATQLGALSTGTYYYDLIVTSGGGVATRLFGGRIFLKAGISHG